MKINFKLSSLVFTILFIFISKINATNTIVYLENKETFPIEVISGQTQIILPAKTTKTIEVSPESVLEILAKNGSKLEFDLNTTQKEIDGYLWVILEKQTLKISDQNCSYVLLKPFRPLS